MEGKKRTHPTDDEAGTSGRNHKRRCCNSNSVNEEKIQEFTPREYQVELLQKALKKNIIVCLGTGSGKTFIAVMLIKELMADIVKPYEDGGKRTFFITHTGSLVTQQAEVLRMHTSLCVGEYIGADGVDNWDQEKWIQELKKNHVFVMTNQILTTLVHQSFVKPDIINLLIIDECHHAVGNDPVVQLMRRFLDFNKCPKILGLTASVLNGKCKITQVENKIRKLEKCLNAVVETPTNIKMASFYATKPKESMVGFKEDTAYDGIKNELWEHVNCVLNSIPKEEVSEDDFDLEEDDLLFLFGPSIKFSNTLKDMLYIISDMGLWCTYQAATKLISELNKVEEKTDELNKDVFNKVKIALEFVVQRCNQCFQETCDTELEAIKQFNSNKIEKLKEIILDVNKLSVENQNDKIIRGIIFVERRITAWMLSLYLQKISELFDEYSFMKVDFAIGHGSNPKHLNYAVQSVRHQEEKILRFRRDVTNILIATQVFEEGMDIPTCNLIVRFDEPKNFRSYVQSKGRARSQDSKYIILVKNDMAKIQQDILLYNDIEKTLHTLSHERLPPTEEEVRDCLQTVLQPYYADVNNKQGASISAIDAISRVNWYCQLLPHDRLTTLVPRIRWKTLLPHNAVPQFNENDDAENDDAENDEAYYEFDDAESGFFDEYELNSQKWYQAYLKLPMNSPCKTIIKGEKMKTKKLAKQSVALITCELLHKMGELNNKLLPAMKDPTEFLKQLTDIKENPDGKPKPGSKKRRQCYIKKTADVLQGRSPEIGLALNQYVLKFTVIPYGHEELPISYYPVHSNQYFGILSTEQLPTFKLKPFPLYSSKFKLWVEVEVIDSVITLQEEQFTWLELFQRYLVNEIFQIDNGLLMFNPHLSNHNYFIAPLIDVGNKDNIYMIDWDLLQSIFCNVHQTNLPSEEERKHFTFHHNKYENSIIQPAYYSKKFFCIVHQICDDKTPLNPFPSSPYKTFEDYYRKKYNIKIQNLEQPLLQAGHVHPCSNMLPEKNAHKAKRQIVDGEDISNTQFYVPELCVVHPIPASLFLQAQYLPSVVYRINSLFLADELNLNFCQYITYIHDAKFPHAKWSKIEKKCRDEVFENCNENEWNNMFYEDNCKMGTPKEYEVPPSSIILKALTSKASNDCINLERLEILGDSFLKYATTIYLFLHYSHIDEGRLTLGRSAIISNFHLYCLGKAKNIGNVLHTEIFSPHFNWIPPGYIVDEEKENIILQSKLPFHLWKYIWNENSLTQMTIDEIWQCVIEKQKAERLSKDDSVETEQDENVFNNLSEQIIGDKTMADCIEALIGAHLLYVGPKAALQFMTWLGIKILPRSPESSSEQILLEPLKIPLTACVNKYRQPSAKLLSCLDQLEHSIGYIFRDKSFLIQALTHPSYDRNTVTDCYQRLEFLGDAVLDYLITWNIFKNPNNFSPGDISDLRSALVNNVIFAKLAVENNFHSYLKYLSVNLPSSISRCIKYFKLEEKHEMHLISEEEANEEEEVEVPKALGDIFESVAGAIYLDSKMSLDVVWQVYSRMMNPLIEKYSNDIPKDPVRQVYEMFPNVKFCKKRLELSEEVSYEATVSIDGTPFIGRGKTFKTAKRNAANSVLRTKCFINKT